MTTFNLSRSKTATYRCDPNTNCQCMRTYKKKYSQTFISITKFLKFLHKNKFHNTRRTFIKHETHFGVDKPDKGENFPCYNFSEVSECRVARVCEKNCLPDMGTRSLTLSAFLMRYSDSATTCWHQKMSFVSQLHVTEVILHLKLNNSIKSKNNIL